MPDGIAWSRADAEAYTAPGAGGRFDDRSRCPVVLDQFHGAGNRAVVEAEPAFMSIPWKACISIDRSRGHAEREAMLQYAGLAGIDAWEIVAHDAG